MSSASTSQTKPHGSLIIGPSSSGKTTILSILQHAASLIPSTSENRIDVFPDNDEIRQLFRRARTDLSRKGRIDFGGTLKVTDYRFHIKRIPPVPAPPGPIERIRSMGTPKADPPDTAFDFVMVDGPGGALFTNIDDESRDVKEENTYRQKLVEAARNSRGLILCVDPSDPDSIDNYFVNLPDILADIAIKHVVPFERVAITLTKADKLVQDLQGTAEKALKTRNPWEYAERAIGNGTLPTLLRYMHPSFRKNICCGFSSMYGFVPGDGQVNKKEIDQAEQFLLFDSKNPDFLNRWCPFGIVDPFVYAATGSKMGLTPIPDHLL